MFLGELLLAVAGALAIRQLFREVPADSPAGQVFDLASLQFLPDWVRRRWWSSAVGIAIVL